MSGVDVLAVLDEAAARWRGVYSYDKAAKAEQARAAVAELIRAGTYAVQNARPAGIPPERYRPTQALRAALDRCRGGAA